MNTHTRVYITGCARSGTRYIADLLHASALFATHETSTVHHRAKAVSMELGGRHAGVIEVNSEGGKRIAEIARLEGMCAIGHVVRHPQRVVASIAGRQMWSHNWGRRRAAEYPHLGEPKDDDGLTLDASLDYWITHNRHIAVALEEYPLPSIRFRIEEPLTALHSLLEFAGLEINEAQLDRAMRSIPKDTNTVKDEPPLVYDWQQHDETLRTQAEALAAEYGYEGF